MKILVACEESQTVTKELRELGHEAYSCDLVDCSGGHPEWHIKGDALEEAYSGEYDMMIAHPPCTYLTVTGNKWMKPEFADRFPNRPQHREDAVSFFLALYNAPIAKIAIENPVGIMSARLRKPDQYVHPYYFGDRHSKKTGLWLKGLPKLEKTEVVEPEMYVYKDGRKDPMWHVETMKLPPVERSKARSKTFPGIAAEMAKQWTIIQAHGITLRPEKSWDLKAALMHALGLDPDNRHDHHGISLGGMAQINTASSGKNVHGSQAPSLYQTGQIGSLVDYCLNDVRLTRMLVNRVRAIGSLRLPGRSACKIEMPSVIIKKKGEK